MRQYDLFHRDVTTEDFIVSLPDRTHAAVADRGQQAVTPGEQLLPGGLVRHMRDHIDNC
ncbi:MAG TPA: hypothetical protein VHJ17_01975 [Thermomonospora sp.]|nr:hypothetical protein [Thermomonospora sp.]